MLAATSAMVGWDRDNVSDNFCATGPPVVTSLSLCLKNQYISADIVKHFLKEVKLFNSTIFLIQTLVGGNVS